jgi:hypothetical protein
MNRVLALLAVCCLTLLLAPLEVQAAGRQLLVAANTTGIYYGEQRQPAWHTRLSLHADFCWPSASCCISQSRELIQKHTVAQLQSCDEDIILQSASQSLLLILSPMHTSSAPHCADTSKDYMLLGCFQHPQGIWDYRTMRMGYRQNAHSTESMSADYCAGVIRRTNANINSSTLLVVFATTDSSW